MSESVGPRKIVRATREITANINGEEYDVLMIPKNMISEIDFSQFPEDDPLRRQLNLAKLVEVDLNQDIDLRYAEGKAGDRRLTLHGAQRLLDSL